MCIQECPDPLDPAGAGRRDPGTKIAAIARARARALAPAPPRPARPGGAGHREPTTVTSLSPPSGWARPEWWRSITTSGRPTPPTSGTGARSKRTGARLPLPHQSRALATGRASWPQAVRPRGADSRQPCGMTMDLDHLGRFDVVLFMGVLYHMEDPLTAVRRLRAVTAGRWPGCDGE